MFMSNTFNAKSKTHFQKSNESSGCIDGVGVGVAVGVGNKTASLLYQMGYKTKKTYRNPMDRVGSMSISVLYRGF